MTDRIAILGDFNPAYYTLHALNDSTRAVQRYLGKEIQFDWIATDIFDGRQVFENLEYKGLWIAPGSPYRDMANVLRAIRYARENRLPAFGNCGGFQHMVIEFARNVCGVTEAGHEEEFPGGRELVIRKLECSLKGEQEQVQIIDHSSLLFQTIGRRSLLGKYFCSYGLNEEYVPVLAANGLNFTSCSEDGHYRSFELGTHPFFVGTLFQPALTSTATQPDPIIIAFVKAALNI